MTTQCADGEQPERTRRAVEQAARVLAELTRARIDVERLDRQRRPRGGPGFGSPALRCTSSGRGRSSRGRWRVSRVGSWLVALYLLITLLAQSPPSATESTVYQPDASGGATPVTREPAHR